MEEYTDIVAEEKKFKPRLFKYPDYKESMTVFDVEDWEDEALLVLCKKPIHGSDDELKSTNKIFIWRGPDFDAEDANQDVVTV